jgi:hypothetical protein
MGEFNERVLEVLKQRELHALDMQNYRQNAEAARQAERERIEGVRQRTEANKEAARREAESKRLAELDEALAEPLRLYERQYRIDNPNCTDEDWQKVLPRVREALTEEIERAKFGLFRQSHADFCI